MFEFLFQRKEVKTMKADLILEFVDLAISLIQTHLKDHEAEDAFLDILKKGVQAYEEHTGETPDPSLIGVESRI
jgi:hypothetical protein